MFPWYPFAPASVRRERRLDARRIWAWNPDSSPPALYVDAVESIFVSAEHQDELTAWCDRLSVPKRRPRDVWSFLLEPYLDTEVTPECLARVDGQLRECGFSRAEIASLRARVSRRMLAYNALVWEWVHLGHYDVLHAMHSFSFPWTFRRFYWHSMAVAFRGFVTRTPRDPNQRPNWGEIS